MINKTCFIITTFLRDELLYKSVQSLINNYFEGMTILVIDQGHQTQEKDSWISSLPNYCHYYTIPFDSGLSYGRNFGVQKAKELGCEYTFISSDSFLFNESIKHLDKLIDVLDETYYSLMGMELIPSICGWEAKLNLIEGKHFLLDFVDKNKQSAKSYFSKPSPSLEWINEDGSPALVGDVINTWEVDICRNIFIATTESLLNVPWDENLLLGEHESVIGETPVLFRNNYGIQILPIKKLMQSPEPKVKKSCTELKDGWKTFDIWTDNGWSKIKYITRHPCIKKIYRILTSKGFIECTDDHSLIINNSIVYPSQLSVGDKLELIKFPDLTNCSEYNLDMAWVLGFFLADGCYTKFIKPSSIQENVYFTNTKYDYLLKIQKILQNFGIKSLICENKIGYKNSYNKKRIYRLSINNYNKDLATCLFSKFYIDGEKNIPNFIYDFSISARREFIQGFLCGDGHLAKGKREGSYKISQKSSCIINGLCYLMSDIYHYTLNYVNQNNQLYYKININKSPKQKYPDNYIKKIEIFNYDGFVYDIETENHHFCGGIGNINLHNSFFYEYKLNGYKCVWTNYIYANKITDRPEEYAKYRKQHFQDGIKKLREKYKITGWIEYINLERAKDYQKYSQHLDK